MKNLLYTISALISFTFITAQTTTENYIKTTTYQVETQNGTVTDDEKLETITYYDGLARPMQIVSKQLGGNKEDIINPLLYDDFGRQVFEYLPFFRTSSSLNYEDPNLTNLFSNLENQYLTNYSSDFENSTAPNPFSQTLYEASPLNRIKEGSAPGYDWRYDTNNVSNINTQVPILLDYSSNIDLTLFPNNGVQTQTLGEVSLSITNSEITLSFDMIMEGDQLKVGQILYLDTGAYVIDGYMLGQLTDNSGNLIPYYAQIQNNYLVITSTNPSYQVQGLFCTLNLVVDVLPVEFEIYQVEQSTNNTIRYEYGTNNSDVKHFAVDFVVGSNETKLIYLENYPQSSLYKTIVKDENWQPNQNPNITQNNYTTEEYRDKLGRLILKRSFSDNEPHDIYYVYDKYGNLTYVIPPLASDEILIYGNQGFRIANQINYPWTSLVKVDEEIAHEYNKKLKDYSNEDLLNADLENKYGGQGGFTVSRVENSDLIILNLSFSSNAELELKEGELISLKPFGEYKDTELGRIDGINYKYYFYIKNNSIYIKGEGKLNNLNSTFTSNTKLTYSQENLWTSFMDVDDKFAYYYNKSIKEEAKEQGISPLSILLDNEYGGRGGLTISIDENDIVSVSLSSSLNTPLKLRQGLVIPLETKRRIRDRELGTISGNGYDYHFSIKKNSIYINGYGSVLNLNTSFTSPPPPEPPNIDPETVGGLCYIYHYDNRNRLINKKIPGKGWEYTVYDKFDRTILTQDAKLRLNNKWMFRKYDIYGRVVYTGIHDYIPNGTHPNEQIELQALVDNQSNPSWYENKIPSSQVINASNIYYSNDSYPNVDIDLLTINYYDDYNFDNVDISLSLPITILGQQISGETKTLSTGSKVRVLDTYQPEWITSVNYYDDKSRAIYTATKNEHLNSIDIIKTQYDFAGKVKKTENNHTKENNPQIDIENNFTYDHVGRLLTQTQIINGSAQELISNNIYNEYGQLEQKRVGGDVNTIPENSVGLQNIDYTYNVRGWLKAINDGITSGGDLFGFRINYNTPEHSGVNSLFNGNISETYWQTASDSNLRSYDYDYDALNRIKLANYHGNYTLVANSSETEDYSVSNINYDKNGNIKRLWRKGLRVANNSIDLIDVLNYSYEPLSNKLLAVNDYSTQDGFKNGSNQNNEYTYDINGNMTKDTNKGIVDIQYNHLNLPYYISIPEYHQTYTDDNSITYTYDALGNKLKKKVRYQNNYDVSHAFTDYNGAFIYEYTSNSPGTFTAKLSQIQTPEGYFEILNPSAGVASGEYVYQYKDHLGNVRLSYADSDESGHVDSSEILKESNYYPFGLEHKGYNDVIVGVENNYQTYQGQERNDELGLNWLSFKWRNHDAALGRFMSIDPLAEDYSYQSPYNFSENRVVDGVELEGLEHVDFRVGFNLGVGSKGVNFNITSSLAIEYSTPNFQGVAFASASIYSGQQLGTSSMTSTFQFDLTAGAYGTIGSGSGSAHNFYTLNHNTPSPFNNTFDTSLTYGQFLTYNSAINSQGDGPGVQIQGLVGLRLGDNFSLSSNNDSDSAPYFSRLLAGGESTDAGWTGGLSLNISGVEIGYQNFTGFRNGLYPGGGVGTTYSQTSFHQSLNSASNFLRIGQFTGSYFTTGWFQNIIHNYISKESTYNYTGTGNIDLNWHDEGPDQSSYGY